MIRKYNITFLVVMTWACNGKAPTQDQPGSNEDTATETDIDCSGEVTFEDPNLESAVRECISRQVFGHVGFSIYEGPLTGDLLAQITGLDGILCHSSMVNIASLRGIECLSGLRTLNLEFNRIEDIGPLRGLTDLTVLSIRDNRVSDIEPLRGLVNLTALSASENDVADIEPLAQLKKLRSLRLFSNQIADIESLRDHIALSELYLSDNPIASLEPLSGLVNLEELYVENIGFDSLDWIRDLTKIQGLWASGNHISDIQPLVSISRIMSIFLDDNDIEDLSPIREMGTQRIEFLYLGDNRIQDIAPLAGIGFTGLSLRNNEIEDVSPLADIGDDFLVELYLDGNRITDLSPLTAVLQWDFTLTLFENRIEDVSLLIGTPYAARSQVDLHGNLISDLSDLAMFENLAYLDISDNLVEDLSPLEGRSMRELLARNNQIHDLSPVGAGIYAGSTLDLTNNRIVSTAPLVALKKLDPVAVPNCLFLSGNPLGEQAITEDIPSLCADEIGEIYYGDGERCGAIDDSVNCLPPEYTYPPAPFKGEEPVEPVDCDTAPRWLAEGSIPGDARLSSELIVVVDVPGEPTVRDAVTGLEWQRCAIGQVIEEDSCAEVASIVAPEDLENACTGSYAEMSDWRVPSPSELATLVSYDIAYPGPVISAEAFPETYPGNHWTSDSLPYHWINFYNGETSIIYGEAGRVRCVRGGGTSDPADRYTAVDTVVSDTWTGLEWQRCAADQEWDGNTCAGIGERVSATEAAAICTGDWRLPTIRELLSLVNPCGSDPSADSTAFPGMPSTAFWSSSSFPDFDPKTWTVHFANGWSEPLLDDEIARVRCIR